MNTRKYSNEEGGTSSGSRAAASLAGMSSGTLAYLMSAVMRRTNMEAIKATTARRGRRLARASSRRVMSFPAGCDEAVDEAKGLGALVEAQPLLAVSATCAAERTPCSSARAIHIHRPNAIHSRTARGSAFIANASGPKTKSSGAQWMKLPSGGQSASTAEHRRRSLLSAADSRRRRAQAHLFRPPCQALAALSGGAARHASRPSRRCHQTAPRPGRSHRRCAPLAVQAASAASAT